MTVHLDPRLPQPAFGDRHAGDIWRDERELGDMARHHDEHEDED